MNSQLAVNVTLRNKVNTPTPAGPVQHCFLPGENPHSVSAPKTDQPKLAGEVGFKPVATISATSGDTYVRPVKNTHQRSVSTDVVNKDGQVSIRGEHLIELSSNLHEQIRAKINQGTIYKKETLVAPPPPSSIPETSTPTEPKQTSNPTFTTEQTKARSEELKTQLEDINKVLFEQIRQKIAREIAKQQAQPSTATSNEPKTLAFKQPQVPAQPTTVLPQTQKPTFPVQVPLASVQTTPTGPASRPEPNLVVQAVELPVAGVQFKESKTTPENLQTHIENLEKEIETLTKEVLHIDKTISSLEGERNLQELSALEQTLNYDEKMMQAVSDWKYTLTNLVNSHSIALKYLKQKTDWLEDKVESIEGHRGKHERMHRKPRSLNIRLERLPLQKESIVTKPIVSELPSQPATQVKIGLSSEASTQATPVMQSTITQTPEINEIVRKEEAQPKQVTQVPTNVTVGQPKVLPGNPTAQINIQAIPIEASVRPKENLPTVATAASLSSQSDIEKQILEAATREEDAREAVQQAKEEQEQKKQDAEEDLKTQSQVKQQVPAPAEDVTQESLKEDLTKLKSSLTTVGNKSLEALSKDERSQMMQHLQTLERQGEVARQFDEIKGVAERRKINAELQTMLEKLGEKPALIAPEQQLNTGSPVNIPQVEDLKIQEKKERSPEEKAKIIAEIKELERQREARKLEERSRPVVKSVPAYGKMLPNTPTVPNVINGIVKNNQGLLLDTVVIIVKDPDGDPVRAFKTNKIGQFAVSTPLPNGVFTLELEKPGFEFDIIEVEVNGGILPPIEIKAR